MRKVHPYGQPVRSAILDPHAIVEFDFGQDLILDTHELFWSARIHYTAQLHAHRTCPFTNQTLLVVQSAAPETSDAKPRSPQIPSWFIRQTLAGWDKRRKNEPKAGSEHSRWLLGGFLGARLLGDAGCDRDRYFAFHFPDGPLSGEQGSSTFFSRGPGIQSPRSSNTLEPMHRSLPPH
jgi:hypothetical protein